VSGQGFNRFIKLCRRGQRQDLNSAPLGFATRVAWLWTKSSAENPLLLWERFSRWAAAAAVAVCLLVATLGEPAVHDAWTEFLGMDPEVELLW
jgi:hypothetical protein